jgi:hypothetical protein
MTETIGTLSFEATKRGKHAYLHFLPGNWKEVSFKDHDAAKAYAKKHHLQYLPPGYVQPHLKKGK